MKKIFKKSNTEHLNAMVKALRTAKVFKITRTKESVIATHEKAGEVYRALKMGKLDMWLIRHADNLFS